MWTKGTKKKEVRDALKLFAVHLVFNATWSIVFFGMNNIPLSLVNIIVLWILIVMVMIKFYKIDKKASFILLPYLAWVSFASILNLSIFLLNI
ncbi:MAG: tryptophan-rich sensory protein [Candidatus Levybacteria bacterium]|nr:tryptophan-rich sensory protein [Candidatus Levybacteria bacterium]